MVNQAMDSLPSTYKQVITLTLEGYRVKEIAEKLNVGEETVKKRKQTAKQVLKEKLGKLYVFLLNLMLLSDYELFMMISRVAKC